MGNVFDRPTNFFPPVRLCAKNLNININHKSASELPIAGLKITVSQWSMSCQILKRTGQICEIPVRVTDDILAVGIRLVLGMFHSP